MILNANPLVIGSETIRLLNLPGSTVHQLDPINRYALPSIGLSNGNRQCSGEVLLYTTYTVGL